MVENSTEKERRSRGNSYVLKLYTAIFQKITSMEIIVAIVGVIQILLIWAIFSMRNHIEKQTAINVSMVRLISKIANNTGTPVAETKEVLDTLSKHL